MFSEKEGGGSQFEWPEVSSKNQRGRSSAKSTDDSLCPISLLPGVDIGCSFAPVLQYLVSDRATAVIVFAWLTTFWEFKFVEVGD